MNSNVEKMKTDAKVVTKDALAAIDELAGNIELKVHLAKMELRDEWQRQLKPRLHEAREHARNASSEADRAMRDIFGALESFAARL